MNGIMNLRIVGIIIIFLAIAGLGYYNYRTNPWISVSDCLDDPESYDGAVVTRFREPMIKSICGNGFVLSQKQGPEIKVVMDTTGLRTGEFVGLRAVFHREGYLEAVKFHMSERRRYKIWLSVPPVLLVMLLCLRYFRFNSRTGYIELRKNA